MFKVNSRVLHSTKDLNDKTRWKSWTAQTKANFRTIWPIILACVHSVHRQTTSGRVIGNRRLTSLVSTRRPKHSILPPFAIMDDRVTEARRCSSRLTTSQLVFHYTSRWDSKYSTHTVAVLQHILLVERVVESAGRKPHTVFNVFLNRTLLSNRPLRLKFVV